VIVLAASGCGGSAGPTKPLTRSELIARGTRFCRRINTRLAAIRIRSERDYARLVPPLAAYEHAAVAEMRRLTPACLDGERLEAGRHRRSDAGRRDRQARHIREGEHHPGNAGDALGIHRGGERHTADGRPPPGAKDSGTAHEPVTDARERSFLEAARGVAPAFISSCAPCAWYSRHADRGGPVDNQSHFER